MKRAFVVFVLGGIALMRPAWAGASPVVFNGGSPDRGGVYFSDANNGFARASAESFVLQSGAVTIGGATWWGGCFPGPACPAGNFTLGFYTDTSGQPGSLIQSYGVGNANQSATGNLIGGALGFDEYIYNVTFAPLALAPGVNYWFAISNNTASGTWGWETTNGGDDQGHAYRNAADNAWGTLPADLAFNLTAPAATDPVPEPATLTLVGLGLAAAIRGRRGR